MFTLVKTLETEIQIHKADCAVCQGGAFCYSLYSKETLQLPLEIEMAELLARLEAVCNDNRQSLRRRQ